MDEVFRTYQRRVLKIGRDTRHSLAVIIPRKVCQALQIEKGATLYLRLEGSTIIISKEGAGVKDSAKDDIIMEPEKGGDIIVDGISLLDLQY